MGTEKMRKLLESKSADIKYAKKKAEAEIDKIEESIGKARALLSSLEGYLETVEDFSADDGDKTSASYAGVALTEVKKLRADIDKNRNAVARMRGNLRRVK